MTSEENKPVIPNESLSMEQTSSTGAKRKRGRPRKYEYGMHELPHSAQPIQSIPPLHSTQDGSNIRRDGVQINHTSGGNVGLSIQTIQALPIKQGQGNRSSRPRDSTNLVKTSVSQASNYCSAPLQGNSGKDDIVGKYFVGKMAKKFPGFSLITVKVKDNQVLKGWIPDENNLHPITSKDDLASEFPMLRASQLQKRPPTIYRQTADPPIPVHLEDVTFAKPLQMRRPVEKSVAKNIIPPAPRPYMASGVVTAAPISVSHGSSEPRTFSKQGTELVNSQPLCTVMPIRSIHPVSAACKQVSDEDEFVEGKTDQKESESLNRAEDSTVKTEHNPCQCTSVLVKESPGERHLLDIPVMDAIKESSDQIQRDNSKEMAEVNLASGPKVQSNATNSEQQTSMEPSEQSEKVETKTDILRVDGSESGASGTTPLVETSSTAHNPQDGIHGEHEMKVDSK